MARIDKFFIGFQTAETKYDVWNFLIPSNNAVLLFDGQHDYEMRTDKSELTFHGAQNGNAFCKMFVLYDLAGKVLNIQSDDKTIYIAKLTDKKIKLREEISAICFFTYINRSNCEYWADYDAINQQTIFTFNWKG